MRPSRITNARRSPHAIDRRMIRAHTINMGVIALPVINIGTMSAGTSSARAIGTGAINMGAINKPPRRNAQLRSNVKSRSSAQHRNRIPGINRATGQCTGPVTGSGRSRTRHRGTSGRIASVDGGRNKPKPDHKRRPKPTNGAERSAPFSFSGRACA